MTLAKGERFDAYPDDKDAGEKNKQPYDIYRRSGRIEGNI